MDAVFFKSGDVFFTKLEDSYVLANLKNDEYYSFSGEKAAFFDRLCEIAASHGAHHVEIPWNSIRPTDGNFEKELLSESLLYVRSGDVELQRYTLHPIMGEIALPWPTDRQRIKVRHAAAFLVAFSLGNFLKIALTPRRTVRLLFALKRRARSEGVELNRVEAMYGDFVRIRKYFYTSVNKCFKDSLITSLYFSLLGCRPEWVFGAQLYPFQAHCWVQVSGAVITDEPAKIARFTPIFSV